MKVQGMDQRIATDLGPRRVTNSSTPSTASPSASPRVPGCEGSIMLPLWPAHVAVISWRLCRCLCEALRVFLLRIKGAVEVQK